MNYTVKLEGKKSEYYPMTFDNEKDAKAYAKKLTTLKKFAYGRNFTNDVVIYSWNDNDSEMTEISRKPISNN